jgi:hypothetical protein
VLPPDTLLGHLAGDNFAFLVPAAIDTEALRSLCRAFDVQRPPSAVDGEGEAIFLCLAVVDQKDLGEDRHPAAFVQAASALSKVAGRLADALQQSTFVCSRWLHVAAVAEVAA